jgi:hypothetical protein
MQTDQVRHMAPRVAMAVLFLTVPFASALVAVAYAPPAHIEVAGQTVSLKPVLGQDTSRLLDGALVRREHAHVGAIGKDIGVDVDADWNQLIPSDPRTRQYLVALWDDPIPQIGRIQDAARHYLIVWSTIGFVTGAAVVGGIGLFLRVRRRRLERYPPAQARIVQAYNRRLRWTLSAVGIALLIALDGLAVSIYRHDNHHTVLSSPLFFGTTLEGTEVNGLMAEVLPFLSILRPRTTFYDTAAENLEAAIDDRPSLRGTDDEVVFVLAEDFEDVNGMARQVGLAAELVDADFIALSGDLTFAGLPVETYIVDTFDYYSEDRPVYFAPGIHDTAAVVEAAQARGWHVAEGKTWDIDGLSLLAAADPRISNVGEFGEGDVLRDPDVDVDTFVADTVDQVCESRPDFVLLHDHVLGRRIAEAGCQQIAVLDGRSYQFVGPQQVPTASGDAATEFTGGSTGGHVDTKPDPGVITHPARFAILTYRPDRAEVRYSVVTVAPDATVTVTPEISLDVPFGDFTSTGRTAVAADDR